MYYAIAYLIIGLGYAALTDRFTRDYFVTVQDRVILRVISTFFWPFEVVIVISMLIASYFERK